MIWTSLVDVGYSNYGKWYEVRIVTINKVDLSQGQEVNGDVKPSNVPVL